MTSPPLVSICIPVYNGESFIAGAIESALRQTHQRIEVLVLDNASTDRTLDVVAGFSDSRLRVETSASTSSAGANWNRALDAAVGDYVKLLSADDYLYPSCIERQLRPLIAHDDVVMVCSSRDIVDESGRRLMTRGLRTEGLVTGGKARRRVVRSGTNPIGETASVLLRTSTARAAGGFEVTDPYTVDVAFWLRVLECGNLFVVSGPLSAYRLSGGSWSVAVAGRHAADYRAMLKGLRADPDITPLDRLLGRVLATANGLARQVLYLTRRWSESSRPKERRHGENL